MKKTFLLTCLIMGTILTAYADDKATTKKQGVVSVPVEQNIPAEAKEKALQKQTEEAGEKTQEAEQLQKSKARFAMFLEANGAITKAKGQDKIGGAAGLDLSMGVKFANQHLYLGPAAGVDWFFYNNEDKNYKTEVRYTYMPIFLDAKIYFLGDKSKKVDACLDLDLGGYVAFKPTTTLTPKTKGAKVQTIEGKTAGGLLFRAGLGLKISVVHIGVGYEMKKAKDTDPLHGVYFKLGFSY